MNKNILYVLCALISFSFVAEAQTNYKKFGFEINGGIREYHGDLGSALYFQVRPDYQAIGGALGMYLNPSFDVNVFGGVGDLGYYKQDYNKVTTDYYRRGFTSRISEVAIGLTYKFNNGYMINEDARFKPFLRAGWGAIQSVSKFTEGPPIPEGYARHRTWLAASWNAGLGVKVRLSDAMDLVLTESFNYAFDDNYDASPYSVAGARLNSALEGNKPLHDVFAYHSLGFVFNFGGDGGGSYKIKDSDEDGIADKFDICPNTPEGYAVDTVGCPLDDDKDGVVNEEDNCPSVAGAVSNRGCPVIEESVLNDIRIAAQGIYFESGKDVIKEESYANLDKLAKILKGYNSAKVSVDGYTDSQGNDESNLTLSQK